jgi:serine/threonine-protein kinase
MDQLGRYQILGELGRGAMGVVFRALDPSIGREVAIKTIRLSELANSEQRGKQRERLFREARSAGILSHPGIVTIYDMAEQDETAYITMEFVPGSTLEQILSLQAPMEPARLFSILRQTAAALDYAHHKGIIHRDIKPANIIVNEAGIAKIADFGIAKISAADQLTQTGLIVGTPNYMAPEQVQGKAVTGLADQYSLSVLTFEMLTGEKPFVAEHLTTLVYQIVCEPPPPARRLNPTLGTQIEAVLQKGLSKLPDERYKTCTAMVDALEAACAASPGWKSLARGGSMNFPTMAETKSQPPPPPRVEPPPPPPPPATPTRDLPSPGLREEVEKKSRAVPILIALLVGCAIGVAAYFIRQPIDSGINPPVAPVQTPSKQVETRVTPPSPPPEDAPAPKAAPVPPPPARVPSAKTEPGPPPQRPVTSVEIPVASNPAGATATLDGLVGTACVTPCSLKASAGDHTISISLAGYKTLLRPVKVAGSPIELPLLTLARASGLLMLQSDPSGAAISIDDRKWPGVTPAQISLAPGKYRLTLEKGDLKASLPVEIRDGDLRHLSVPLAAQ